MEDMTGIVTLEVLCRNFRISQSVLPGMIWEVTVR